MAFQVQDINNHLQCLWAIKMLTNTNHQKNCKDDRLIFSSNKRLLTSQNVKRCNKEDEKLSMVHKTVKSSQEFNLETSPNSKFCVSILYKTIFLIITKIDLEIINLNFIIKYSKSIAYSYREVWKK